MIDAKLKDLPANEHQRILTDTNDKFMPSKSNEAARAAFSEIIDQSVQDFMSNKVYEPLHNLAVYLKY